jgi:pyridoxal 5'-phosphate synthase pdxS subunit
MATHVSTHEQGSRYEVQKATWRTKVGLAEMLRGGVIMDVVNAEQAQIAEEAGAVAVMALERVPADIRREGGVARMSDPLIIEEIMNAVTIPVMAKCRIGHFAEAMILEALGVDFIDESEVLTPADEEHHVNKHAFKTPFVCGARDLGEALRRIGEGAAMIRTKGEAGTGNIVEAVRHMRAIMRDIRRIHSAPEDELMAIAKQLQAPYDLVVEIHQTGTAARAELLGGRNRDPRGRRADDCGWARRRSSSGQVSSSRLTPKNAPAQSWTP